MFPRGVHSKGENKSKNIYRLTFYIEGSVQRTSDLTLTNLLFVLIISLLLSAPSPSFYTVFWDPRARSGDYIPQIPSSAALLSGSANGGCGN